MEVEHIIYPYGDQEWRLKSNGKLHRVDGPAVVTDNGNQIWWFNGQRHRLDGPAVILANNDQKWYINGELHRVDGPAIILANGHQEWYIRGKLHRAGGPAVIWPQSGGGDQEWWMNGLRHRDDGPAIITTTRVEYYNNGIKIKIESYNHTIHDKLKYKTGSKTKAASREYLQ